MVLQGKHPIIVEYADDLVATPATCLANTSFLRDTLAYKKVPVYLNATITEIGDGFVMVKRRTARPSHRVRQRGQRHRLRARAHRRR